MTTQETANFLGFPMPDTYKELDWQTATKFYWVKHPDWQEWKIKFFKKIKETLLEFKGEYEVIPAPQDEFLKVFTSLAKEKGTHFTLEFNRISEKWFLKYDLFFECEADTSIDALATLYLHLKQENLLSE